MDANKPDCALPVPGEGMTLLNLNEKCSRSIVAREVVEGFEFEPKCLVLVLAHANERLAFDAMMAAGRLLSDPFVIDVNYTVATGPAPDVKLASTNCHNGKVLLRNYELDRTGQETLLELEAVRANVSTYSAAATEWKEVMRRIPLGEPDPTTGAFTLYDKPPPSPPGILGPKERLVYYEEQLALNEARETEILEEISDCFVRDRSDTVVCGLPENEAPDPWVALDGVKCRGYATRQAREEDYCGYWDSEVNPLAARSKQRSASCSPWARTASARRASRRTARRTRRARSARASPTSST